jgi:hypothetical protein
MPPEYSESWKRFFVMKKPIPAELIYAGNEAKIYGLLGRFTTVEDQAKLNEIIKKSSLTLGLDIKNLSWATWKVDVKKAMQ